MKSVKDMNLEEFEAFLKEILPKAIEALPKSACPDANTMAEFLDWRLRGKRLNHMYSHLLTCKDCMKFTRDFHEMKGKL